MFFFSLTFFCTVFEDPKNEIPWIEDNLLYDSLSYFNELCSIPLFSKTCIIVIFNNVHNFQRKLNTKFGNKTFTRYFPTYQGGTWLNALNFLHSQFVAQNPFPERPIHFFCWNAVSTDESKIKDLFTHITNSILDSHDISL
jgi:hypothetical protein